MRSSGAAPPAKSATPPPSGVAPPSLVVPPSVTATSRASQDAKGDLKRLIDAEKREKSTRRLSRTIPAATLSNAQESAIASFVEQATKMLQYQSIWEDLIGKDPDRAIAFTRKACKLLQAGVELVSQVQKKSLHNQEWACCLVQSHFRARQAMRAYKEHQYRSKVAHEMVQTERSYMRALGAALSLYREESSKVLAKKDLNVIFGNMDNLRQINVPFWRDLENRVRDWNVDALLGDLFTQKLKTVLNEYLIYVKGYDRGLKLHDSLLMSKEGKAYAQVMDRCLKDPVAQSLPLGAYMILPVQRFPRYKLLLADLMKHTQKTHPDYGGLEAALKDVDSMCAAINDATRHSEAFAELQKMEAMFEASAGIRLTDRANRMLKGDVPIQEAVLDGKTSKWKDRNMLVFDDMIVCVRKLANKPEGWHVEWTAHGNSLHIPSSDPNVTSFELVEYRRVKDFPFAQCVTHSLKPIGASHSAAFWIDTVRNYGTLMSTPSIMSDSREWLTTNLISLPEWEMMVRSSRQKYDGKTKPTVFSNQQILSSFQVVLEGQVTQVVHLGKHVQLSLRTRGPGAFFGIESILRDPKTSFEARVAKGEVVMGTVPFPDLLSILAADPHLHHRFWLLACVVLAEEFHVWELPKALEKHYFSVCGHRDFTVKSELEALFHSKAVSSPQQIADDAQLCATFQINPAEHLQGTWDQCILTLTEPRKTLKGTLYLFESYLVVRQQLLGHIQVEVIPFPNLSKLANGAASQLDLVYLRIKTQKATSVQLQLPQPVARQAIDDIKSAHAKFKSGPKGQLGPISVLRGLSGHSGLQDSHFELTDQQWDAIFEASGTRQVFKRGDKVLEEGKTQSKIFQLMSGRCKVFVQVELVDKTKTTKESQQVGVLEPGDIFGETMYLFGGSATATVVADGDQTEVYALDRPALERLFSVQPEMAGPFYKAFASSLEGRLFWRNERVLRAYSVMLAKKIRAGDIGMDQLLGAKPGSESDPKLQPTLAPTQQQQQPLQQPRPVRVLRPVRKESLGLINTLGEIK